MSDAIDAVLGTSTPAPAASGDAVDQVLSDYTGHPGVPAPPGARTDPAKVAAWAQAGTWDRLKMLAGDWSDADARVVPPVAKDFAAQGIKTVAQAAGATAGGAYGGIPGAMAGVTLADAGAQRLNMALGLQQNYDLGETIAAPISVAGRGPITAPLAAMTATTANSLIDRGEVPTWSQLGLSAIGGELGAGKSETATPIEQTRADALSAAQAEGIVVDPNTVNSSLPNRIVGSVGGKSDMKAAYSIKNAPAINDLGVRAMGLPSGTPLTSDSISDAVALAQKPYNAIRSISPEADQAIDDLRTLQHQAGFIRGQYDKLNPNDPSLHKNPALEQPIRNADLDVSNKINDIMGITSAAGRPELGTQFQAAQTQLAKIGEVENAFDPNTGILSAAIIAARQTAGSPLTDELATIANTYKSFKDYVQDPSKIVAPGSNKLTPIVAAQAAYEGMKALGPPGILAGGVPFLDKYARGLAASGPWQKYMATPSYGYSDPGMAANLARYSALGMANASTQGINNYSSPPAQ